MQSDDIVAQLQVELSFIERHGTESLNDLDHAALLKWAMDEIERLRAEYEHCRVQMLVYQRIAELGPQAVRGD
jgi:hypothetical protein